MQPAPSPIYPDPTGGIRLLVKVVPGASRDQIAGLLGDRLKVRVAAPPEAGKANRAVCELIAAALALKPASVTVISGHTSPDKTLLILCTNIDSVRSALHLS